MKAVDASGVGVELMVGIATGPPKELTVTLETHAGMTYRYYRL